VVGGWLQIHQLQVLPPYFAARKRTLITNKRKKNLPAEVPLINSKMRSSDFFLCDIFSRGNLWRSILTFSVDEIARLLPISRWYPSFLDESTQIWMNNYTFIHNLDVSSTRMDEGGSCTVVKIASALILIIEKKNH
jgi:hypothetical protein